MRCLVANIVAVFALGSWVAVASGQFYASPYGASNMQTVPSASAVVSGRVIDLRSVNVAGEPLPHMLARLSTPRGVVVVDLGTSSDVGRARVQPGNILTLTGYAGRINGRPVFVADRIQIQGGTIVPVVRSGPLNGLARQQLSDLTGSQPGAGLVEGRLVDTRQVALNGQAAQHLLAKVQVASGRQVVVDLGPPQDLGGVQLNNGRWIAAAGAPGRINDHPVLVARYLADIVVLQPPQPAGARSGGAGTVPTTQPAPTPPVQMTPGTQPTSEPGLNK